MAEAFAWVVVVGCILAAVFYFVMLVIGLIRYGEKEPERKSCRCHR